MQQVSLLERVLHAVLEQVLPADAIEPMLWGEGWVDGQQKPLRAIAVRCGRSHECVRQWRFRMERALTPLPKGLSRSIRQCLVSHLPLVVDDAIRYLQQEHLIPKDVIDCTGMMDRLIDGWARREHQVIASLDRMGTMQNARAPLLVQLNRWGVADLSHTPLQGLAAATIPGIVIGQHAAWKPGLSVVLVRRIHRAWTVQDTLFVDALVECLSRCPKSTFPPKAAALSEALLATGHGVATQQHGMLQKATQHVCPPTPIEQAILAVLKHGPLRGEEVLSLLPNQCPNTVRLLLQHSAVIMRVKRGWYAPIGYRPKILP